MFEFKPVTKPVWAKGEGAGIIVDAINNELERNPTMSLAEFAKLLDKAIVKGNHQRLMEIAYAQFDKE